MSDLLEHLVGEGRVFKRDEFVATAQYDVLCWFSLKWRESALR
jgi:hypothetical protein